jgi:hypothetical protein
MRYLPVKEPWAGVIRTEADRNIVAGGANGYDIATRRVNIIVRRAPSAPDDIEGVAVQLSGSLGLSVSQQEAFTNVEGMRPSSHASRERQLNG